jgi:lipoprotein-releasing system permease protein
VWKQGGITDYQSEVEALRTMPHVEGAAPAVLGKAIVSSPAGEAFITIKGIDPKLEPTVTDLQRAMQQGRVDAVAEAGEGKLPGILLGRDLTERLGVSYGDSVTLLTPHGTLTPMGMLPRQRRVRVAGIFSLGLFEFDSSYGFMSLAMVQRLLDRQDIEFIQLRVDDIYRAPAIADEIARSRGALYLTEDWADMNRSLFSALWLEKMAISITIGLIVMVAALNIIASLILLVMEKSRDIAILKTMGASARSVTIVFMLQGLIIGVVGTFIGATLGYAVATALDRYQVIKVPMDVYQVAHVPFTILPFDFALVIIAAVVICFLATIYPSRQAARLDPAQALRYQ